MNESNVNEGAEGVREANPAPVVQRQHQHNLQGLLRLAIHAREEGPDEDAIPAAPMDYERAMFLAEALDSVTIDPLAVLRMAISILSNVEKISRQADMEGLSPDIEAAFRIIEDTEDPHNADGFCFLNGFDIFPVCYNTRNAELWLNTNQLLGAVCQHCEQAQNLAVQNGLLKKLIEIIQDPLTDQHKDKCVYAMSSVTRGQSSHCYELVYLGGVEVLVPLLASEDQRLKNKTARLLFNLLNANPKETRERLIPLNIIKIMVPELDQEKGQHTEQFLALLHTFIDSTEEILQQCNAPEVKFKKVLQNMSISPSIIDDPEQNMEIIEFIDDLLKIFLYDASGNNATAYDCEEEADR